MGRSFLPLPLLVGLALGFEIFGRFVFDRGDDYYVSILGVGLVSKMM